MRKLETLQSWLEWCLEAQSEMLDLCTSCDGDGHHGYEEETGCLYSCYMCGETGKYHLTSEAMP